jgi:hypothetical protein
VLIDMNEVATNIERATTQDLLCRVTFDRAGMDPMAVSLAEHELRQRGVTAEQQRDFLDRHANALKGADGLTKRCSFCVLPARREAWSWHRLWGRIPLFPRLFRYCREHDPDSIDRR